MSTLKGAENTGSSDEGGFGNREGFHSTLGKLASFDSILVTEDKNKDPELIFGRNDSDGNPQNNRKTHSTGSFASQSSASSFERKQSRGIIRAMDSILDKNNKRLRIVKPQGPVMLVDPGYNDSLAAKFLGKSAAKFLWITMDHGLLFYINGLLCLVGLVFTIVDITTPSAPAWSSGMSVLVVPWGVLVFSLLNVKILKMLMTTFNTWFLVTQIAAMMVCIGLVAERSLMVCVMLPTMLSTILVDAYPQYHRWHVTALSYFVLITFTIAFDLSLAFSLFPVATESINFKINEMEFSTKALAFGCSINLLAFSFRHIAILFSDPNCLVMYTSNLKSDRYTVNSNSAGSSGDKMQAYVSQASYSDALSEKVENDVFWWRSPDDNDDMERVWIIRPKFHPVIIRTKQTLAQTLFGDKVNRILWATAKNPISFLLTIIGVVFLLPTLQDDLFIPPEASIGSYLVFATLGTGFMILNTHLVNLLLQSFQTWFLLALSAMLVSLWYSDANPVVFVSIPVIVIAVTFSILMDAYPGSGRLLAGARFYFFKISLALVVVTFFLVTDKPLHFFSTTIGEITISGAALNFSAAVNLAVFGMRNLYQLIAEPECLVVLSCLMEYAEVTKDEAMEEIEKYRLY